MNLKKCNSDYSSLMHSEKRKRIGAGMLLAWLFFACGTALYIPKENARISKDDVGELKIGRAAYISKCGSCHSLTVPEKYSPGEWKILMKRMAPKSNLTLLEEKKILKYLTKNDSLLIESQSSPVEKR